MPRPSEQSAAVAAGNPGRGVAWPLVAWAVSIAAALLLGYSGVLSRLITIWSNKPDYSHGFVVPLVSAAYLWLRRESIVEAFRNDVPVRRCCRGLDCWHWPESRESSGFSVVRCQWRLFR